MHTTSIDNFQHKTSEYDKTQRWLENIQSHSFRQVFARVYLGLRMFLFHKLETWTICPDNIHQLYFAHTMDHSYCIPDSTTPFLDSLLMDYPDAIPFSVMDMEHSPTLDCKYTFQCSSIIVQFRDQRGKQ